MIADDAVGADHIATDAVTADGIATDGVAAAEIAADAVGSSEVAADAIGASEIAADAVGASEIAADAVGASEIAAGAVGTAEIADGTVGADDLAATLDLSGKTLTLPASVTASPYLEYREEQAAGTDAGGFTSGAWQTRTLNTEHADAGGHGSLAANQITLAAGTYEVDISCPAGVVNNHQAKLYNVTDAADTLIGTSEYCGSGSTQYTKSRITGRFTIAGSKVFEVRHQCQTTKATDGFGNACNFGVTEIYTVARFWKVG
jgi:hypothetical protein